MVVRNRIAKATLNDWQSELSNWTDVESFRHRVDEINNSISRSIFFRQAGLAFLRDAWIASRVAAALSSDLVRLAPAERPDFEVQTSGSIKQFEATEADQDDRRRGDEEDGPELQPDPVEKWRERFEAIPSALDRVVTKKIAKDYPSGVGLVIYVNLSCYRAYLDEGLPILRKGTAPAKDKFGAVFVMWEGTLYKFWDQGVAVSDQWQYARDEIY